MSSSLSSDLPIPGLEANSAAESSVGTDCRTTEQNTAFHQGLDSDYNKINMREKKKQPHTEDQKKNSILLNLVGSPPEILQNDVVEIWSYKSLCLDCFPVIICSTCPLPVPTVKEMSERKRVRDINFLLSLPCSSLCVLLLRKWAWWGTKAADTGTSWTNLIGCSHQTTAAAAANWDMNNYSSRYYSVLWSSSNVFFNVSRFVLDQKIKYQQISSRCWIMNET